MRPIDWYPLVAIISALGAVLLSSLIPNFLGLDRNTAAIIIWLSLVPVALRVIKEIRIWNWKK